MRVKNWLERPIKPMSALSAALWLLAGWTVAYIFAARPLRPSDLWLWVLIAVCVVSCWLITNVEAEFTQSEWYSVYLTLEDTGITYCTGRFDFDGAEEYAEDLEDWLFALAEKYGVDRWTIGVHTGIIQHISSHEHFYEALAIEADAFIHNEG